MKIQQNNINTSSSTASIANYPNSSPKKIVPSADQLEINPINEFRLTQDQHYPKTVQDQPQPPTPIKANGLSQTTYQPNLPTHSHGSEPGPNNTHIPTSQSTSTQTLFNSDYLYFLKYLNDLPQYISKKYLSNPSQFPQNTINRKKQLLDILEAMEKEGYIFQRYIYRTQTPQQYFARARQLTPTQQYFETFYFFHREEFPGYYGKTQRECHYYLDMARCLYDLQYMKQQISWFLYYKAYYPKTSIPKDDWHQYKAQWINEMFALFHEGIRQFLREANINWIDMEEVTGRGNNSENGVCAIKEAFIKWTDNEISKGNIKRKPINDGVDKSAQ